MRPNLNLGTGLVALCCALAVAVLPTSALAQTDVTTSRIGGRSPTQPARALPGVTVECNEHRDRLA